MKKTLKNTLAVILAVVMVLGIAPLNGFVGLELPDISNPFATKAEAVAEETNEDAGVDDDSQSDVTTEEEVIVDDATPEEVIAEANAKEQELEETIKTQAATSAEIITMAAEASGTLAGEGSEENPYLLYTEEDLLLIQTIGPNCYFELQNDITIQIETWTPIGTETVKFSGYFDGNGHTITNLAIVGGTVASGLFGYNTGVIENLHVEVSFTSMQHNVGGIAGHNTGIIRNCTALGEISCVSTANYSAGGIVGYSPSGTISDCRSSVTIMAPTDSNNNSGGIVGNSGNSTVIDCTSTSNVTGYVAGGLVGFVGENGTVTFSSASGAVSGYYAGGLVGRTTTDYYGSNNTNNITYSSASGNVTGQYAGGLIGECNTESYYNNSNNITNINYCYATGDVIGSQYAGGLIGYNRLRSSIIKVKYCYASGIVNERTGAGLIGNDAGYTLFSYRYSGNEGNTVGFSASLSNLRKQATYYDWDFEHIWSIDTNKNDSLPFLDIRGEYSVPSIAGNGTIINPYLISTEEQLRAFVRGEYGYDLNYKLGADITLSTSYWTAIGCNGLGTFTGVFDGDGHTISGIKTSYFNNSQSSWGVFGRVSGTVKNLTAEVTFTNISGYVGGIAGYNTGTIENCTVSGTITGGAYYLGGIAGYNNGTIKNCTSSVAVTGSGTDSAAEVGGVIGRLGENGTVTLSSASGAVSGYYAGGLVGRTTTDYYGSNNTNNITYSSASGNVTGQYAGGLIGECNTESYYNNSNNITNINYCYATGDVIGSQYAGGLIGYNRLRSSVIKAKYCYASGIVNERTGAGLIGNDAGYTLFSYRYSGNEGNTIGFGTTLSNLKKQATYHGWDFEHIWNIEKGVNNGFPYINIRGTYEEPELEGLGEEDDPYIIETEEQLTALAHGIYPKYAFYELGNDIEVTAMHWSSIGTLGMGNFTGCLDGNGYTISGIKASNCNNTGSAWGLFAYLEGQVKNLNLEVSFTNISGHTGGIAGHNTGTIENCTVSGTITGEGYYLGGIAGYNNGTIKNCTSSVAVTGSGTNSAAEVGGVIGRLGENGTVTLSSASGAVSGYYAGGLVGRTTTDYYGSNNTNNITYSSASGNVTGQYAGGLIGECNTESYYNNSNNITNINYCYATGDVIGSQYAGGLIGYNRLRSSVIKVKYCYASGIVNEHKSPGLIGNESGYTLFSYYKSNNTGNKIGFAATSDEMRSRELYYGWDFDTIWTIDPDINNGYPTISLRGTKEEIEIEGYGDEDDPYILENEQQLIALVNGELDKSAFYELGNDIQVTAKHWTPIGGNGLPTFTGDLNGNGYKITGIKLKGTKYNDAGLFGAISGSTIKNLGVEADIDSCQNVGAIVGTAYNSIISQCYADGALSANSAAGGLVGVFQVDSGETGYIADCYTKNLISGTTYAGGIVGYMYCNSAVTIGQSYSIGVITGKTKGGIIGAANNTNFAVNNCYYNSTKSTVTGTANGTPLTDDFMKLLESFTGFDFTKTWSIASGVNDGYPYLRSSHIADSSPVITKIEIKTLPNKTTYEIGEQINASGLTLNAVYNNGTVVVIENNFTLSPLAFSSAGTKQVTVTYQGFSTTFNVTVKEKDVEPVTLTRIELNTTSVKKTYEIGEALDTANLIVTAVYSDNTTQIVTGYSVSAFDSTTTGTKTITVTFEGKSATYTVTVNKKDENAPQFEVIGSKAQPGGKVDVIVNVSNNPGIVATKIGISYDTSVLTLESVQDGGLLGTGTMIAGNNLTAIPYSVTWEDSLSSTNHTGNGNLVIFTFKVNDNAPIGSTPITLTIDGGSTFDVNLEDVAFEAVNGTVEIVDRTPGDANDDGIINLKDVAVIRRYIAGGWDVTIKESNADVNGDGVINLKDVALVRRYIAGGWDVELI